MNTLHAVLEGAVCCLLVSVLEAQQAQQGQPVMPAIIPPPKTASINQTLIAPLVFASEVLVGEVRVMTLDKRLGIRWSYDLGAERQFYLEEFDVSYWPTAAARINDGRLTNGTNFLVAGKRPVGSKTVIERWELTLSSLPEGGTPTAVTKTTLFNANVAGKRIVRMMTPVNGVGGAVFVHFDDSNDLYRIDAQNGALTLLLTPQQVPSLGLDTYVHWSGGKLSDGAYCYVYQCDFTQHDDGVLLMYDTDGDGNIDATTPVPKAQWSIVEELDWAERYNH